MHHTGGKIEADRISKLSGTEWFKSWEIGCGLMVNNRSDICVTLKFQSHILDKSVFHLCDLYSL